MIPHFAKRKKPTVEPPPPITISFLSEDVDWPDDERMFSLIMDTMRLLYFEREKMIEAYKKQMGLEPSHKAPRP